MTKPIPQVRVYHLTHQDSHGRTDAKVIPEWGSNVVSLSYKRSIWASNIEALEPVRQEALSASPTSYGMPILAPTAGRVGTNQSGIFEFDGKTYCIQPRRHGFARMRCWKVETHSLNTIKCSLDVDLPTEPDFPVRGFPFRLRFVHIVTIDSLGLTSRITVINTGKHVQPISLGWHPYLRRYGECAVRIPARARWLLDDALQPTPTGIIQMVDGIDDFRAGRWLGPAEHWDHVFTDLETNSDGSFECCVENDEHIRLKDERHVQMRVRRNVQIHGSGTGCSQMRHVQLYTPPNRNAICIEPLSAPPNSINLAAQKHPHADMCALEPAGELQFELRIGIQLPVGSSEHCGGDCETIKLPPSSGAQK